MVQWTIQSSIFQLLINNINTTFRVLSVWVYLIYFWRWRSHTGYALLFQYLCTRIQYKMLFYIFWEQLTLYILYIKSVNSIINTHIGTDITNVTLLARTVLNTAITKWQKDDSYMMKRPLTTDNRSRVLMILVLLKTKVWRFLPKGWKI